MAELGRHNGDKRSKFKRARNKELTTSLYLKGWTQSQIAQELGLSQPVISGYLKKAAEEFKHREKENYAEYYYRESEKLQMVERQAWEAWDMAMKNAVTEILDEEGNIVDRQFTPPNPAFLITIVRAIATRYKISGLEREDIKQRALEIFQKAMEDEKLGQAPRLYMPVIESNIDDALADPS